MHERTNRNISAMDSDSLEYELIFLERPQYLYVCVKADRITEALALRYMRNVAQRCRELNCKRRMLYRDIPEMLPRGTLYFMAAEFQAMMQGVRIAFINPYVQNRKDFEFSITVGTNRGADQATFDNAADAEAWLLSS